MKLYVLVRKDLSYIQQAVQAAHAASEYALHYDTWENGTLVLLGVKNERALHYWRDAIESENLAHKLFHEPDISADTALAFAYDESYAMDFKKQLDKKLSVLRMPEKELVEDLCVS